jgi:hypothetical protein
MDGNNQRFTSEDYPTGEIPFSQLIFPVSIAEGGDESATSDLETGLEQPIKIFEAGSVVHVVNQRFLDNTKSIYNCRTAWWLEGKYWRVVYAAENKSDLTGIHYDWRETWGETEADAIITYGLYAGGTFGFYTHNGKTVHYYIGGHGQSPVDPDNVYVSAIPPINEGSGNAFDAWTIIYGDISGSGEIAIPVQWMRSDGEILEDTFEIEVGESGEPSPPQPDPWGGYADVSWGGHHYNLNRRIVPEVHYANGYLWQEGTSEYTVEQAASMGWLILIR